MRLLRSGRARVPLAVLAVTVAATGVPGNISDAAAPIAAASPAAHLSGVLAFTSDHELRGDFGPASGNAKAWASKALTAHAGALGVRASSFRWELVRHSLVGTSVRGRQYRGEVPVARTDVLVASIHGRIAQLDAHATALPGAPAAHPVGATAAKAAAVSALHATSLLVPATVTREMARVGDRLVDTYQVSVVAKAPARVATVAVDAASGVVRRIADDSVRFAAAGDGASRRLATVNAKVYDPNPIVTSRNTKLRSPFETGTGVDVPLDSAELTAQLKTRAMADLDPSKLAAGMLTGSWVNIVGVAGFTTATGTTLSYSRSDPRFVGLMAYAHVDRYQRFLQSLGFRGKKGVNNESQEIAPTLAEGYDNSFYQPGNDLILFGGGGVPDAEDAEVILHEYGHAMQDAQVPGYMNAGQTGAMGEGFGDFDSANYYALTSGGFDDLCVGDWDGTTYSTLTPPCLRRLDSPKRFPKSVEGEVHADGEMWSAYLWRLRSHLGKTAQQRSVNAIKLVLTMHELLTPNAKYGNAVAGLRTAATALGHPEWTTFVNKEAKVTGYPLNP